MKLLICTIRICLLTINEEMSLIVMDVESLTSYEKLL